MTTTPLKQVPLQLIVGLCNPGNAYAHTRHNAGADFVTQFAKTFCASPFKKESRFHGLHSAPSADVPCHCLLPNTYMNNSGEAVSAIVQFYKIPVESVLVIHDELDLPVGAVRLKRDGGHGGHNGLRDIIEHLGSTAFLRMRIGIGRPSDHQAVADYVLTQPSSHEAQALLKAMQAALAVMPEVLSGKLHEATQKLHTATE